MSEGGIAALTPFQPDPVPNLAQGQKAISDGAEFCTISTAAHPPNDANPHDPARVCPLPNLAKGQAAKIPQNSAES